MKKRKKLVFSAFFLIFSISEVLACDMCGCFMGILPSDRRSFIGMNYRFRSFSGESVSGSPLFPDGGFRIAHADHNGTEPPKDAFEIYRAVELRGRYYLHPRLELNLVLPYLMNSGSESNHSFSVKGIGDLSLLAGWQLVDEASTGNFRHRLLMGTGVKLATGNENMKEEGIRHSLMLQCGTGSNDVLFYASYQLAYKNLGLNFTPLYKINGENRFNEHIDNSKTISGSLFYKINAADKWKILPSLQSYYEFTKGVYVNDALLKSTRMNVMMCGPGLDVYWKNLGFSISAIYTCYEEDNKSGLKNRIRTMVGLHLYFDQTEFIF